MIRVGEVIKNDKNPFMVVSSNYEEVVRKLAKFEYPSNDKKLLACLLISQTEKQYKKYLLKVLLQLENLNLKDLIQDWQDNHLDVEDKDFQFLLSQEESNFLEGKDIETQLEEYEKDYPTLFNDGLNTTFYPTKKKGMLYLRRMIVNYKNKESNLDDLQKLILYFITAQLLESWESTCIHLGMMLLENWEIKDMSKWFTKVWPIYTV